eukprot:Gregarina_sp_Pseudo_9__1118@NODE_172_length_3840_cov_49_069982_g81_i1_p2_GENE_NODE_172_length_3840_cov_49_069982_g81_i1NODE_172_length_3840_cov_49_069982_g81_i1_p2_ORF_typecomplete_len289_score1_31_NODE_172_length_3840_cov_49_069982_g81_i127623628
MNTEPETRSPSRSVLVDSYSKALAAGSVIVNGLESRGGTGVSRLRRRVEPYTAQASEGLMMAAETADRLVVDPLLDEYSQGGPRAVFVSLLSMIKDVLLGFLAGLFCGSNKQDSHDVCEDRRIFTSGMKPTNKDASSFGTYLLSKVDSLFYFPLVITLKSRAASVFTQDPREDNTQSYVYCLGWEVGSWTVESSKRLWAWLVAKSPTTKLMHLVRSVTAPEVNFAGFSECLARRIPPRVHPILAHMSRLREVYTCERRRSSTTVRQNYCLPVDQPPPTGSQFATPVRA